MHWCPLHLLLRYMAERMFKALDEDNTGHINTGVLQSAPLALGPSRDGPLHLVSPQELNPVRSPRACSCGPHA